MRYIVFAITILLIASCETSLETQVKEIVVAKNLWLESSVDKDYSYKVLIQPSSSRKQSEFIVKVVNGESSISQPIEIASIKNIFKYTFEAIKNENRKVTATYDTKLGYPNYIVVVNPNVIDGTTAIKVIEVEFI